MKDYFSLLFISPYDFHITNVFTPITMINITKQTPNVDKDVEKEENLYTAGQKKLVSFCVPQNLLYDTVIPFFGIYPQGSKGITEVFVHPCLL